MIELWDRRVCDDGRVLLGPLAAMEAIYNGHSLEGASCTATDDAAMHNVTVDRLDSNLTKLDLADGCGGTTMDWFEHWNTPEPYASLDVLEHCLGRCTNNEQRDRVLHEHALYEQRGMIPVLRHLVYMVDTMRGKGVLWGVGRGSSVSSYMLYLIGINRIDPMRFDLDVAEFLK